MNTKKTVFLTADWKFLVMLNYEAAPETVAALQKLTPPGTELDTWQGKTLVSMVGFLFLNTRLMGVPVPFHRNFEEVNLRFYVRRMQGGQCRRGVVFVREIVPLRAVAAVARLCYGEKYVATRMGHRIQAPGAPSMEASPGTEFSAGYQWVHQRRPCSLSAAFSGTPRLPEPGSEEEFITEHYWGYSAQPSGGSIEYEVEHPRWRVWPAQKPVLDCDPEALYGGAFLKTLRAPPSSAFVAEGSSISVRWGARLPAHPPQAP